MLITLFAYHKVLGCFCLPFCPLELLEAAEDVSATQGRFACYPEASGAQSSSEVSSLLNYTKRIRNTPNITDYFTHRKLSILLHFLL